MTSPTTRIPRGDCLDSTCLKWTADGSLSEIDQRNLLKRLCNSDPEIGKTGLCIAPNTTESERC